MNGSLLPLLRRWIAERLEVSGARAKTYSGEGFTYERGQIDLLADLSRKLDETEEDCPGFPNCVCIGKAQWATENDPHGTFGAPGMMGG